jgi:hypothetical protein
MPGLRDCTVVRHDDDANHPQAVPVGGLHMALHGACVHMTQDTRWCPVDKYWSPGCVLGACAAAFRWPSKCSHRRRALKSPLMTGCLQALGPHVSSCTCVAMLLHCCCRSWQQCLQHYWTCVSHCSNASFAVLCITVSELRQCTEPVAGAWAVLRTRVLSATAQGRPQGHML